jgi:hypothetical protein
MATFSATDAGLSGFTLARSRPRVFLVWGLILLAISFVTSAATILTVGQAMVDMQSASQTGDQEATMQSMTALAPFYLVALPLSLLYYGIATAAVNRMVLRPDDSRNAFIRLGGDELRMIVVMIAQWLIGVVVVIVAVLLAVLLAALGGAVAGGVGRAAVALLDGTVLLCGGCSRSCCSWPGSWPSSPSSWLTVSATCWWLRPWKP